MDVEVVRSDHTVAYLRNLPALSLVVRKAAKDVKARAQVAIKTGPKTGMLYRRRRKGKAGRRKGDKAFIIHRASAPGEAPASDTGTLANSIQFAMTGELEATVSVGASYGAVLELRRNRPFLRPAVESVQPVLVAAVTRILEGRR